MSEISSRFVFLRMLMGFIFITALFFGSAAKAVVFEGISAFELQQLKKRLPELNSEKPSYSTMDKAVRYLISLDTYASVSVIEDDKGRRRLIAVPLKRVGEIKIVGNEEYDEDELLNVLGLKIGTRFDSSKIMSAGDAVKEFYGKNGYFNTIVSFTFEEMTGQDLRVVVQLKERSPCVVKKFNFQTKNQELANRLEQRLKKFRNKNFTEEGLISAEQQIQEYLTERRYLNTEVRQKDAVYNKEKTTVQLNYEIQDPYSYEVIIKGNTLVTTADILRGLNLTSFGSGTLDVAEMISRRAREYLINTGFPHARVQFKETVVESQFRKVILLDISEGARVRINRIDIVGRISRPSKYYREIIVENSSELVDDGYFVRQDLEVGLKNLITELNNQGYLNAKSQSFRVEYSGKKDQADVTIFLDEGPLTTLTTITFDGLKTFSPTDLLEDLPIRANAPLRLNQLESSIQMLKTFYFDRGFIEMRIENEGQDLVRYDEKGMKAEVHFQIHEGPQVSVKSIFVEGNTFTKDYVVLREIGIEPGELLTLEKIEEGKRRLNKLGIFSRIDLRTLEANTAVSARTLIISVTERNPGLFRLGAGVTNKNTLTARGFAGVSYNNLGGTARAVSVRGTLEQNLVNTDFLEYEASVGYLEPFLFNSSFRGRANYSRSEKVTDFTDKFDTLNIRATDRVTLSVEKDLTSKITFSWLAWGFDSIEKYILPGGIDRSRIEVAYVGPSLDIDFRDNPFLPTKGTYTRFDSEYASPALGSSDKVEFVRTQGLFTHYLPFSNGRVVWANSVRGGYENNLSNKPGSGVPDSFAFFLGDYTTIRGYSGTKSDRIPTDEEFPYDTDQLIIPGEATFYLYKSEIRFPLGAGPIGGVVFYDAGAVDVQGEYQGELKQTAGLGLRINTPVGPISLDYGRKLNAGGDPDSNHEWHLSIGTF